MEENGIGTNPGGVMEGAGVSGGAVMGGDAEIARLRSVLADEIARRESAEAEVARLTAERDALAAKVARVEALADAADDTDGEHSHRPYDDGEPYGEVCDCEIGDDHDATGEGQ